MTKCGFILMNPAVAQQNEFLLVIVHWKGKSMFYNCLIYFRCLSELGKAPCAMNFTKCVEKITFSLLFTLYKKN